MSVLLFIIILVVLILVHEFGHFIVAKKIGIRVDEFGLGFPPKLFGKKYGETEYTVNAIPFGGFVRIFGEDPTEVSEDDAEKKRSFSARPILEQAAVISAGVLFNVLFAWALIAIGFSAGLPMPVTAAPAGSIITDSAVTVLSVEEGSPAAEAGLLPGDKFVSLSGEKTQNIENPADVQSFIGSHGTEELTVTYTRGGEEFSIKIMPERSSPGGKPMIGIAMDTLGTVSLSPVRAIVESAKMTVALFGAVAIAFYHLLVGAFTGTADFSGLTGPVGIVGIVGDAADFGFVYLIGLTAFISINLAVINLVPFPALDGGRLLFIIIEAFKGSPLPPRVVRLTHAVGFIILILLMLAVTYNDLIRIFS